MWRMLRISWVDRVANRAGDGESEEGVGNGEPHQEMVFMNTSDIL